MAASRYTEPKIAYSGKKGYVWFRYRNEHTGVMQLVIRKGGANYPGLSETKKRAVLAALQKALKFKLDKQGWNPLTNSYPQLTSEELDLERLQRMTLLRALDYAFKEGRKKWSPKTVQDYGSMLKYLGKGAVALGIDSFGITELKRLHYRKLLETTTALRKLSAKGFNKYRDFLSSLLGLLLADDILEYNPAEKIASRQVVKTFAHRPPEKEERTLIVEKIKADHRDYYRFLCVLYGCTIRPKEICALKIKDIDHKKQMFHLIPDGFLPEGTERNTKTLIEREAVIPDWVCRVLEEMNLQDYDPDWYIFSTHNKHKSFLPGPERMHKNTPTNWWRRIVKKGLGLDVDQYSLKKLSGDDMVMLQHREGVDALLEMPRMQMGHTNSRMTEIYVRAHHQILKEIIRRKMPEL